MNLQKTKRGYFCRYRGYWIVIWKRPHGKYACIIGRGNKPLHSEGYFGTYLSNLAKVKSWVKEKIK